MTCNRCGQPLASAHSPCSNCPTPDGQAADSLLGQILWLVAFIVGLFIGRAVARMVADSREAADPAALPMEFSGETGRSACDVDGERGVSRMLNEQRELRRREEGMQRAQMWMRHSVKRNDALLQNLEGLGGE